MFEEEEQHQAVPPLKAALEDAVLAAEAEGRTRQPGSQQPLLERVTAGQNRCQNHRQQQL